MNTLARISPLSSGSVNVYNGGTVGPYSYNVIDFGTPAVANDANGNIEVFARGSDNNMWRNAYLPGWNGWKPL